MTFKLTPTPIYEYDIERDCIAYLKSIGAFVFKSTSSGYYDTKAKRFRKQVSPLCFLNGVSDCIGIFQGKPLYIEWKTEGAYKYIMKHYEELRFYIGADKKKRHLREQIWFIEETKKRGGISFFACSIETVKLGLGL